MKYLCAITVCMVAGKVHAIDASLGVDQQREAWVLVARQGQVDQAEQGLKSLFEQTRNHKVRDDLIAIMIRAGHRQAALVFCEQCELAGLSEDSMESLARAARDEQQFKKAATYYSALQLRSPTNKNAWLGALLTHIDAHLFAQADLTSSEYERRFGVDAGLTEARQYLLKARVSDVKKLQTAQGGVSNVPVQAEQVLAVYKAASGLRSLPVPPMEELMSENPQLFKPVDRLWLTHSKATLLIRTGMQTEDKSNWLEAMTLLNQLIAEVPKTHDLFRLARQDKMVLLVQLREFKQAERLAQELLSMGYDLPAYVQEARADALLGMGYSTRAIRIYEPLFEKNPRSAALRVKLLMAYTDAEQYKAAQKLLDAWVEKPTKGDFTLTQQTPNGGYEQWFFWKIKLKAWRGDLRGAERMAKEWNDAAPANPWSRFLAGDVQRWQGMPDAAEHMYRMASPWLEPLQRYHADAEVAQAKLDQGDVKAALAIVKKLPESAEDVKALKERLVIETAPELSVNYQGTRTDALASSTQASREQDFELKWQSKANAEGHRLFTHYESQVNNHSSGRLRADYFGVGAALNFYPVNVNVEAGAAQHLNHRAYVWAQANYRANDHWGFNALAEFNSADTPLKALAAGDHANQLGVGVAYRANHVFSTGLSAKAMHVSDGNVRRNVSWWARQELIQRDRWHLNATLMLGYSSNRKVKVDYFNPSNDRSAELSVTASYRLPVGGRRSLTQELSASVGQYAQAGFNKEQTWSVAYRHQWKLSPMLGLSYQLGRKRAMYDGRPEYKTFVSTNLQWKF